jgi:hypothetical protein
MPPNLTDCTNIPPNVAHDCINAICVPSTTYGTPGKYANIANCQGGCARSADCLGECIPAPEITALQQKACNLQSKFCR